MKKGFTLMELVIVIAIITILSSLIVPALLGQLEITRLKGDIHSVRVIQNAIDLYQMDSGKWPVASNTQELIAELTAQDYLKNINTVPSLHKAVFSYDSVKRKIFLDVSLCQPTVKNAVKELLQQDSTIVIGAD